MVPPSTVQYVTIFEPHRDDGLGSTDSKHRSTDAEQVTVCEALTLSLLSSKEASQTRHLTARCLFAQSAQHFSHKGTARAHRLPLRVSALVWQLAAGTCANFAFFPLPLLDFLSRKSMATSNLN